MDLHGRRVRVDYSSTTRAHAPTPGEYRGRKSDDYGCASTHPGATLTRQTAARSRTAAEATMTAATTTAIVRREQRNATDRARPPAAAAPRGRLLPPRPGPRRLPAPLAEPAALPRRPRPRRAPSSALAQPQPFAAPPLALAPPRLSASPLTQCPCSTIGKPVCKPSGHICKATSTQPSHAPKLYSQSSRKAKRNAQTRARQQVDRLDRVALSKTASAAWACMQTKRTLCARACDCTAKSAIRRRRSTRRPARSIPPERRSSAAGSAPWPARARSRRPDADRHASSPRP